MDLRKLFERGEVRIVLILTVLSVILTLKPFILLINALGPGPGLILKYAFMGTIIYILLKGIGGVKLGKVNLKILKRQTIGSLFLLFAVFMVLSWGGSCWYALLINGSCEGIPSIYLMYEDGALWWLYSQFIDNIYIVWFLTYPVSVAMFSTIGVVLLKRDEIPRLLKMKMK